LIAPLILMTPLATIMLGVLITHDAFNLAMGTGGGIAMLGVLAMRGRPGHPVTCRARTRISRGADLPSGLFDRRHRGTRICGSTAVRCRQTGSGVGAILSGQGVTSVEIEYYRDSRRTRVVVTADRAQLEPTAHLLRRIAAVMRVLRADYTDRDGRLLDVGWKKHGGQI